MTVFTGNCASRCLKKRAFETEEEALEELKFLSVCKEYRKLKRAYLCTRCGKWHLTKQLQYDNRYKEKHEKRRKRMPRRKQARR